MRKIGNGVQAETWKGRKIRKNPFFCPIHLFAVLPSGLSHFKKKQDFAKRTHLDFSTND